MRRASEPQASGVNKAGEQTEESEVVDPTPARNDNTSPEDADETDGDPQRNDTKAGDADDDHHHSSANDTEQGGADDKSPKQINSSPVTHAAREQMPRDTYTRAEPRKAKEEGKERDKEKEALRSPVRRC